MMDKKDWALLTEKYLAAETSLDEERQMRHYATTHKVAPEWRAIWRLSPAGKTAIVERKERRMKIGLSALLVACTLLLTLGFSFWLTRREVASPSSSTSQVISLSTPPKRTVHALVMTQVPSIAANPSPSCQVVHPSTFSKGAKLRPIAAEQAPSIAADSSSASPDFDAEMALMEQEAHGRIEYYRNLLR